MPTFTFVERSVSKLGPFDAAQDKLDWIYAPGGVHLRNPLSIVGLRSFLASGKLALIGFTPPGGSICIIPYMTDICVHFWPLGDWVCLGLFWVRIGFELGSF